MDSFASILLKVEQIRRGGRIRQGRGVTSHFDEMGGLWESQQWRRCCAVCVIPGGWGAEAPHNQSVSGGSALPPYRRPNPFLLSRHRLHYTQQGIKRSEVEKGRERRERLPITPHILRMMETTWEATPPGPDTIMLWVTCCLGFFGFLRWGGELTVPRDSTYGYLACHLSQGDAAGENPRDPRYASNSTKLTHFGKA